jgi:DNA helicase-2/ATP-dependent DNA helicase PcrA
MKLNLRPAQQQVLDYPGGRMGVSAVPGSGKTFTLSALAARLIADNRIGDEQEILIVTLVNSAVENFSSRISSFLEKDRLIPNLGYRVRTLHGLAHDIVNQRPSLVGLANDYQIIDERAAAEIRENAVRAWLRTHWEEIDSYLDASLEGSRLDKIKREDFPKLAGSIALAFIRTAKDRKLKPEEITAHLNDLPALVPLAAMGADIYADYQRALAFRGAVDFDDLISLALSALQLDRDLLVRLRQKWPYILEDEAQDSSRLQQDILSLLAGPSGNWVRVGDPNQAIYETFTTASPEFLKAFIREPNVYAVELPNSGRSGQVIINLANELVRWTIEDYPAAEIRRALSAPPYILPAPPGDPQPNPVPAECRIYIADQKLTPEEEIKFVVDSLAIWLPKHPDETAAALVPQNKRGFDLVTALKERKLPVVEILNSTDSTREAAGALQKVLQYLSNPKDSSRLAEVYKTWRRKADADDGGAGLIRKCPRVEEYIWPQSSDWLDHLNLPEEKSGLFLNMQQFRDLVQRWQRSILMPVDQLVLSISQDLFTEPADLAVAQKLAVLLSRAADLHPAWRLGELVDELRVIAANQRKFMGFSGDDTGFNPDLHKGKVVVSTVHKAKGLEWDRVYLMSLSNYDFPSGLGYDDFISEKWFIRGKLNLEAEALAQLDAVMGDDPYAWYEEGLATVSSRQDYVAERLRLLYVGITRARKELMLSWNSGRKGDQVRSAAWIALESYWREHQNEQPAANDR